MVRLQVAGAGAALLATAVLLSSPASAVASTSPLTLSVADLYDSNVPAGGWVPVALTITNRGGDFRGQAVLTAAGPQSGGQQCFAKAPGATVCFAAPSAGGFGSNAQSAPVTYRVPVDLAADTTKRLVVDVVASSSSVHASVVDPSGTTIASADGSLGVIVGANPVTMAVIADDPSTLSVLGEVTLPGRGQAQVTHLLPTAIPESGALLQSFTAVVVDDASTQELTSGQRAALEAYVDAGGTLVIAGGVQGSGTAAGLPRDLVPAAVSSPSPLSLPMLAAFVGAAPTGPAEVSGLAVREGRTIISEGPTPLVVEADRGAGHVVVTAFDPAAPPFDTWAGGPVLLRRLLTPDVVRPGIAYFGGAVTSPGLAQDAALMSGPTSNIPPFSLPSAALLGGLLAGYILLVGPLNFWLLARLRRRDLAWVTVPALSLVVAVVAYGSGLGSGPGLSLNEVRVLELYPGASGATVADFGAMYLPHGGAHLVDLTRGALVTGLGGTSAAPTVHPGPVPDLTLSGGDTAVVGFASTRQVDVARSVVSRLADQAGTITGTVTNDLGVGLSDVMVVSRDGSAQKLGSVAPGASVTVHLTAGSSPNGPFPPFVVPPGAVAYGPGALQGSQLRRQEVLSALEQMALQDYGPGPVLVGLTDSPVLPPDTSGPGVEARSVDAVVMPLRVVPAAGTVVRALPGQLLDATSTAGASPGAPLQIQPGGSALFRFQLPGRAWSRLSVTVTGSGPTGPILSSNGPGPSYAIDAYDPATGSWDPMPSPASGVVPIAEPARHLQTDGTVIIRVRAGSVGMSVVNYPRLDADPAGRTS